MTSTTAYVMLSSSCGKVRDKMDITPEDTAGDADNLRREVFRHTQVGSAPLVPEIRLHLLREQSPLWRAFGDGPEADAVTRPYWAFAWSSGQALARFLLDHPKFVAGRSVLDFGAGCGIAAIAAHRAGAAGVTASEIDPVAIAAIGLNAQLNRVQLATVREDLIYSDNRGWNLVLVGDLWYDTRNARHGFRWLQTLAGDGVLVLIADPGRHHSPSHGLEELACYPAWSVPDLEHLNLQEVRVYRLVAGGP